MHFGSAFLDIRKRYKIKRSRPQLWHFREHDFGFIQIPKVATRSIRQALFEIGAADGRNSSHKEFEARNSAHLSHREIRKRVDHGLFAFAFVRHPLARLYSAWANKLDRPAGSAAKNIFSCHGMYIGMPFGAFVQRVCTLRDDQLDRHLRSQSWFLSDAQGLLPRFVGKLENLDADWRSLRDRLPILGELPHVNKATHGRNFMGAYDHGTLEIAVARFRDDFELFGYDLP